MKTPIEILTNTIKAHTNKDLGGSYNMCGGTTLTQLIVRAMEDYAQYKVDELNKHAVSTSFFMIKIVIITPQWNTEISDWTEEQGNKIHEWFTLNSFEIPFVPQVGMMIDLDDFFNCEEILNELDANLGYVTVNQIVIGKNDIALHCI